ncbi:lipid-A-disaccharide synthase [Xinfangfangia sp. D13-10-4-6]|uniref:lipid-A-disaccharide synthase n=1 Tax=Pseudogemmobacter hezensis TaxID=2737662 RepID=UPI0015558D78|nr:lipid-A-disaccharide synthase [Pseudogemmobacter hezensis]NPD17547.1 lipid-A-disaccharide synthase [Pseudogemmobacter hezensis]
MNIFLIAGEPSGDRLGAALMAGLRALRPDARFTGVGGPAMQAEGLDSLFPMQELSVMGIAEIAPKYFHLKRRIRQTADAVLADPPAVLITIDSPDFCLRVARLVKEPAPEIPTVHYVAPSVWAWRPGRAKKMAGVIDHVLALLPFEPPYMQAAGMSCDFVGHPVVAEPVADAAMAQSFRATHGIAADAPLLMLLPGSRRGEVSRLLPPFGETVAQLAQQIPGLRVVLPTPAYLKDFVAEAISDWAAAPILLPAPDLQTRVAAFAAADAALAASGTVSLELAAQNCPMVIAYDMAPLTLWLMRRMIRIDTVTLVNLVSETRVVPEFIGKDCRAANLVPALAALLGGGPEGARQAQLDAMALTILRLGRGGEAPGLRAARSVLQYLQAQQMSPGGAGR